MAVWYCIPSKRPLAEADRYLSVWRERGYKLALWRDAGDEPHPDCDLLVVSRQEYPGWGGTINSMGRMIFAVDSQCSWICCGGDDTLPDDRDPELIATENTEHFNGTFGVVQPTADRWGEDDPTSRHLFPEHPAHIERIAGSPWIGREYFKRANGGNGPIWAEYKHMYDDQDLQEVAIKLGIFWQRPDVKHYHDHWSRTRKQCPDFAKKWNDPRHFEANRQLFERRRASGFPGSQPLPAYAVGR